MGIKGLLQFLKEEQQHVNMKDFKGCTAAVDAYCWLHKAVYGCVEQIALGNDQGQYIRYCEKLWNSLLSSGVKPILVFDGQNLPAKANTEKERRERRKANRERANALLAEGKRSEARQYFERSIDITPQMAHKVIVAAVKQGIDCIVAPYEADAQLAYLSITGIAQLVISEDSDLLTFGCHRVIFKYDYNTSSGVLISQDKILKHKLFSKRFTFEHFLHMCLLSGCDYLPSLPGIGLAKSCKFISQCSDLTNIAGMLRRLPLTLKLARGSITDEYIEEYKSALSTFKHQVIFNPRTRKREHLLPIKDSETGKHLTCCGIGTDHPTDMSFCGRFFPEGQTLQMALGNVNLHNYEKLLPEIDPDLLLGRKDGKLSIWHPSFKPKGTHLPTGPSDVEPQSTRGKSAFVTTPVLKRRLNDLIQSPQDQITVPQSAADAFDLIADEVSQAQSQQSADNDVSEPQINDHEILHSDNDDLLSPERIQTEEEVLSGTTDLDEISTKKPVSKPNITDDTDSIIEEIPSHIEISQSSTDINMTSTQLTQDNTTPDERQESITPNNKSKYFSDTESPSPASRKRLAPWVVEAPEGGPVKLRPLVEAISMSEAKTYPQDTDESTDKLIESETLSTTPISETRFNPFKKPRTSLHNSPQSCVTYLAIKAESSEASITNDKFMISELKVVGSPAGSPAPVQKKLSKFTRPAKLNKQSNAAMDNSNTDNYAQDSATDQDDVSGVVDHPQPVERTTVNKKSKNPFAKRLKLPSLQSLSQSEDEANGRSEELSQMTNQKKAWSPCFISVKFQSAHSAFTKITTDHNSTEADKENSSSPEEENPEVKSDRQIVLTSPASGNKLKVGLSKPSQSGSNSKPISQFFSQFSFNRKKKLMCTSPSVVDLT